MAKAKQSYYKPYYKDEKGKWHIDLDWLKEQLEKGIPKNKLAKEIGCSVLTLNRFIEKLKQQDEKPYEIKFEGKKVIIFVPDSETYKKVFMELSKEQHDKWFKQGYESIYYVNKQYKHSVILGD